uniref:Non-specific serine/threonine protein kinase n=1 Tax=Alexandrium catenella TaxID=2925 RepID=A0A7S1R9Q7_ALECA|mmetsp:Transcript_48879/g.130843  ORF Transcript_48879/g.130843 Transcript_48879/m.130843 type:complete len:636 (+) Transcript_48879:40-1947(+)
MAAEAASGPPNVQQLCPRPPPAAAALHGTATHGGRRLRRASCPTILETVGTSEPAGAEAEGCIDSSSGCDCSSDGLDTEATGPSYSNIAAMDLATPDGGVINRAAFRRGWRTGNVHDHFVWDKDDELGRGAFGCVFRGKNRYRSSQQVAVKELSVGRADVDSLWSEIAILSELDHPHVLRFLEAFEDPRHVYVVTEVCLGGPLSAWLPKVRGDERFVGRVAQEVTGALAHCHARGVCHRDLKLDNILLVRNSIDSPVRVADFGLARRSSKRIFEQRLKWASARENIVCSSRCGTPLAKVVPPRGPQPHGAQGSRKQRRVVKSVVQPVLQPVVCFTSCAGTPEYMAPEVMRVLDAQLRSREASQELRDPLARPFYDFRCDLWSLGVIVHVLLTGDYPFSLLEVSEFVSEGKQLPPLPSERPPELSQRAQCFVGRCLEADFRQRATAQELLRDPWVARDSSASLPTPSSATDLSKRLRRYSGLSRFKRAALLACVRHLSAYEHEQLRAIFRRVDVDNSGSLTLEDIRSALQHAPDSPSCDRAWIEEVARKLDSERKGVIDYTEFMAAVMDPGIEDRPELARAAFNTFDLDGDGALSKSELDYILEDFSSRRLQQSGGWDAEAKELSYEGFLGLLRNG